MERRFIEQLLIQGHELHASVEVQLFKKPAKIIFVVLATILSSITHVIGSQTPQRAVVLLMVMIIHVNNVTQMNTDSPLHLQSHLKLQVIGLIVKL